MTCYDDAASPLDQRQSSDAALWVLSGNPSRYFYEAMGGKPIAERKEAFAGTMLDETAYAWLDLRGWQETHGVQPSER